MILNRCRTGFASALSVVCLLNGSVVRADDEWQKIDLARVPPIVLKAVRKAAPTVKMVEAHTADMAGVFYRLRGKDAQSREASVTVDSEVRELTTENEVAISQVPKSDAEALSAKQDEALKGFKPTKFTKEVYGPGTEGMTTRYCFYGNNARGQKLKARFDPGGYVAVTNED